MKISTLRKAAQSSTKYRGHAMQWGEIYGGPNGPKYQNGECRFCGSRCWLEEKPAPNSTSISGTAVATNCAR